MTVTKIICLNTAKNDEFGGFLAQIFGNGYVIKILHYRKVGLEDEDSIPTNSISPAVVNDTSAVVN